MGSPAPGIALQLVEPLLESLADSGINVPALLRDARLRLPAKRDPSALVPLARYVELMECAAAATGDEHFGMHLARFDEPGTLGVLGYLFMSAASLLDTFEGFCAHLDALQEATTNRLLIEAESVTVQYRINDARINQRRQDAEYSISAMHNLVRLYCGAPLRPRAVHFEHQRGGRYATYREHFQCDVLFEQPCNELVYRREGFNVRSRHRSHLLNPIIATHLSTLSARHGSTRNWRARVTELIETRISDSDCTQASVALALGVSVSTLIRRLREERASFATLLRERRLQYAERLLALDDTPVAAIALAVGYAENASFTRAFRRRHALSPEQYRRAQRASSARGNEEQNRKG